MGEQRPSPDTLVSVTMEKVFTARRELAGLHASIYYVDADGEMKQEPVTNLKHVIEHGKNAEGHYDLYLEPGWEKKVLAFRKAEDEPQQRSDDEGDKKERGPNDSFSLQEMKAKQDSFRSLSKEDRVKHLEKQEKSLETIAKSDEPFKAENAKDLLAASADTHVMAKVALFETQEQLRAKTITEEEAKAATKEINDKTRNIVNHTITLLDRKDEVHDVLKRFTEYSGASTLAHMNRVFLTYARFLLYYNEQLKKGLVSRLRLNFHKKYRYFYDKVITRKDVRSLEDAVERGMAPIEEHEIGTFATGAMLHDIGKIEDIEYFDSDQGRDFSIIKRHVFNGYNLIIRTTDYPISIAAIAGFHHEYYNHESGYGVYRMLLEAAQKHYDFAHKLQYAFTYDYKEVEKFEAYSFFPVKVLEVVDIYDALTDPGRKYRGNPLTLQEAFTIMLKSFIVESQKLDPIIFDLFVDFISLQEDEDFGKMKVLETVFK